jgi:hypothetical protein
LSGKGFVQLNSLMSSMVRPARFRAFWVAGTGPQPMMAASQPATAMERILARGFRPSDALARLGAHHQHGGSTVGQGEDEPAVTVPPFGLKAGFSEASCSSEAS